MYIIYHNDGESYWFWDGGIWVASKNDARRYAGSSLVEKVIVEIQKEYGYEFHMTYERVS